MYEGGGEYYYSQQLSDQNTRAESVTLPQSFIMRCVQVILGVTRRELRALAGQSGSLDKGPELRSSHVEYGYRLPPSPAQLPTEADRGTGLRLGLPWGFHLLHIPPTGMSKDRTAALGVAGYMQQLRVWMKRWRVKSWSGRMSWNGDCQPGAKQSGWRCNEPGSQFAGRNMAGLMSHIRQKHSRAAQCLQWCPYCRKLRYCQMQAERDIHALFFNITFLIIGCTISDCCTIVSSCKHNWLHTMTHLIILTCIWG